MMLLPMGSHYVALGSSFAAGPGLRPRAAGSPRRSGRSAVNYAHLTAERLGLDLHDATYSGATTRDLLDSSPSNPARQIQAVTPATRLVTVTAGGNDVGYLPALTLSSLPEPLRRLPSVSRRIAEAVDTSTLDPRFTELESNLHLVISQIRDRAPNATVALIDYLTIVPPRDDLAVSSLRGLPPLSSDLIGWARNVSERLTATTAEVASASGSEFISAADASRHHHAWSPKPWTRKFHLGLRGGAPYHPTAEGMQAIADLLCEHRTGPTEEEPR